MIISHEYGYDNDHLGSFLLLHLHNKDPDWHMIHMNSYEHNNEREVGGIRK